MKTRDYVVVLRVYRVHKQDVVIRLFDAETLDLAMAFITRF
jgi:hypothetical protein